MRKRHSSIRRRNCSNSLKRVTVVTKRCSTSETLPSMASRVSKKATRSSTISLGFRLTSLFRNKKSSLPKIFWMKKALQQWANGSKTKTAFSWRIQLSVMRTKVCWLPVSAQMRCKPSQPKRKRPFRNCSLRKCGEELPSMLPTASWAKILGNDWRNCARKCRILYCRCFSVDPMPSDTKTIRTTV